MSYIDKNLLSDEHIVFRTRKHVIIFFLPVIWTIFSFYAANYMNNNPLLERLDWTPWVVAVILWAAVLLNYYTSEFVVTDKRVMMREGFFFRHANELRIASISQVNISQSILGQMLDFGDVAINAFGAFDSYATLSKPFTFQKYVNEQLDKLTR